MKLKRTHSFVFVLYASCLILGGCSNSLIYSTSVNLPVKTLQKKQIDIQGGVELFPETRPDRVNASVSPGGSVLIGYGITNKTAVYTKAWLDFSTTGLYATRSGFSLNFVNQLKEFSPTTKLLLLPKIGIAMDGKYKGGYGLELPVMLHYSYKQKMSFYGGFGFIYGLCNFDKATIENTQKLQSGYAISNHMGSAIYLYKMLRLNVELTTLFQHNHFENNNHFILSPSVGIAYTFKPIK